MNKIILIIGGALILFIGGWLVISQSPPAAQAQIPDLTLADYSGNSIRLADFSGRPLILNSWAAWCPFCKQELPDFAALQKELGDKIVVVAIDRAEPLTTAKKYSDETGVAPTDLILLLDPDDSFYQAIGGFSMPETLFINREGKIADHKRGPMPLEEMRERVKKIL